MSVLPPAGAGGDRAPIDPARVQTSLDGALLWGIELEPTWRVLGVTLEPDPRAWPRPGGDRRVQLLGFPVSTILASLRRSGDQGGAVLTFAQEQLLDVSGAFAGASLELLRFGWPEPPPGDWGPAFSLQGRSSAPDGTRRTVTLRVAHDDLTLDLFARFDDLELKDANGQPVDPPDDV